MLTLLCSLPTLNKMMCPNQSLLALFLCQKIHQAYQLLAKTFPKVGHLKGYIVLQHCFGWRNWCLSVFLCCIHMKCFNYSIASYMANFTFAPAFYPYRYMHRSFLDGWNLCSCIQFTRNTLLSNGRVGGGVHILTYRFHASGCREGFSYNLH